MNKIGLHIIDGWKGAVGHPWIVKMVNVSAQYVYQMRQQVGGALIIVRWTQTAQPLDDPIQRARQFVEWHKAEMLEMRRVAGERIAFEGFNEISGSHNAAYCAFECERLRLMHGLGLNSVVGNFSVGTPALSAWQVYRPMLQEMREGDLLGLHEYWVDHEDIDNRWHCGRWTLSSELEGVPIVVTECGRDRVEDKGAAGWKHTCGPDQFFADIQKYHDLLVRFSNVYGATIFTVGGSEQWRPFDASPVWPNVVGAYHELPAPPIPKPPSPRPLPSDETATDLPTLMQKVRWWQEEYARQLEDGDEHYAEQILYELIDREDGLLYRAERAAKTN